MSNEEDDETAPAGLRRADAASISTELPVVVLGDDDETLVSTEFPRVRLLQGRIDEARVLYPIYALDIVAGLMGMSFAVTSKEWSAPVVWLAWSLLALWNWFYGVAYRYRRTLLKYVSVFMILALTAALVYFSIERAQPQMAMTGPGQLAERDEAKVLYGAAVATVTAAGLLIAHLVFLGRGYRQKKP